MEGEGGGGGGGGWDHYWGRDGRVGGGEGSYRGEHGVHCRQWVVLRGDDRDATSSRGKRSSGGEKIT